ncbi:MAG: 5'-methylthioadenosine/adenosylhomocysteine nucleosidase [Clostridia bacterium]|nr:5'-methylthioadenosine/adenosylhomocysteine nucleosidase [Clostridia bacterium]
MIGIIGAMAVEVEALKSKMQNASAKTVSNIEFTCGLLSGKEVVVAQCGIGKVFAAICAQTMILEFGIDTLINTGVAGTLTKELSVCDVAISCCTVQHDMDTSPIGDPVGLISGINVIKLPASEKLAKLAEESVREVGLNCKIGCIASGDQFIAAKEQKEKIISCFGAIACEMEGAAIGHVAYVNKVDYVVIRAISDSADGEAEMDYPTFVKKAAESSAKITLSLVSKL